MGADKYTPNTEQVRDQYTREQPPHIGTVSQKRSELDRWLEQVKREAKAEALTEAADELAAIDPDGNSVYWDGTYYQNVTDWLRDRAQQVRGAKPGQPDYAELFCRSMLSYSAEEYAPHKAEFEASQREDTQ
ncbi:hypothetical protein [Glutamicibacter sp. V16R2B1]|uniref:hypothetical protein n=1 Tax=Glutamicibacter sp. V16R2B1 TaxID=2036207 RepID=UPI0010FF4B4E|nr:hypothetical protein [Glutamicibacter sp. V16R2B1]TLK56300.1 hypothetical protein FDN03_02285 [Glutamicibacter sp. V16R2B1]